MNESVFHLEVSSEMLYGIRHHRCLKNPDTGGEAELDKNRKNKAIVFMHGWGGYRTGPHDMLVKLARHLATVGYDCFRFDFRGKGYSQGVQEVTGNRSMLVDLDSVLSYVNELLDQPEITLIGICSGARLALYYARKGNYRIKNVIELSSPVLHVEDAGTKLAVNQTKSVIINYAQKVFNRNTWFKLLSRELHFSAVLKNIIRPFSQLFQTRSKTRIAQKRRGKDLINTKSFTNLSGRILLIHGEKDPETQMALQQIEKMLNQYNVLYNTVLIKNANHSFYSLIWEKEIIETITNWMYEDDNCNNET